MFAEFQRAVDGMTIYVNPENVACVLPSPAGPNQAAIRFLASPDDVIYVTGSVMDTVLWLENAVVRTRSQ